MTGIATARSRPGAWIVDRNGWVVEAGSAPDVGDCQRRPSALPIVGIAPTARFGYWLAGADGGVFSFGDAAFHRSMGGVRLNQPIVGIASTPSARGYWLVAADGGVFSFGTARFRGSAAGRDPGASCVAVATP